AGLLAKLGLEKRAKRPRREWGPVRLCRTGRGKRFPRRMTPRSASPNGAREAFPSSDDSPFGFAERGEGRSPRATTRLLLDVATDGQGALVVRQVGVQHRDRREAVVHGLEVGARVAEHGPAVVD